MLPLALLIVMSPLTYFFVAICFIALQLYFLPTYLAFAKGKRDRGAIFVVNLFGGALAGIGWVVALVWAVKYEEPDPEQVKLARAAWRKWQVVYYVLVTGTFLIMIAADFSGTTGRAQPAPIIDNYSATTAPRPSASVGTETPATQIKQTSESDTPQPTAVQPAPVANTVRPPTIRVEGFDGDVYGVGGPVSAPHAIYAPDPPYTEEARQGGYQGSVGLWLVVDAGGSAREVRVARSLGRGLDESAIETVSHWRFEPAIFEGHPVPVAINLEVKFNLH